MAQQRGGNEDEVDEDFSELDGYKGDVNPDDGAQPVRSKDLPDGNYEASITSIQLTRRSGYLMVAAIWKLKGGEMDGAAVDHSWFLSSSEDTNRMAADFRTLGIPSDLWSKSKQSLPDLIRSACVSLTGRRFRFGKTSRTRDSDGKVFHNVNIFGVVAEPTRMPVGKTPAPVADEPAGDDPF